MPADSTEVTGRDDPSRGTPSFRRLAGAVSAGIVAGYLFSNGLGAGAALTYWEDIDRWSGMLWGGHWVFRSAAALASAVWAGCIAGVLGRRFGTRLGLVATLPGALLWLAMTLVGWGVPIHPAFQDLHVPLGYKLAGIGLVIAIPAAGWFGGGLGEQFGSENGDHFDSRGHSLLGIKWYHYLWIPFLFQALLLLFTVSGIYGFEWFKALWRSGSTIGSIIPSVFAFGVWSCLYLVWEGGKNSYLLLSELKDPHEGSGRAKQVVKYSLGYPVVAAVLQVAIIAAHAGLVSLFT